MKKSDMPRCNTCHQYGRPASDWGAEHDAGGCGHPKIIGVGRRTDVLGKLDDKMMSWPCLSVKMGNNFGCIHHSSLDQE